MRNAGDEAVDDGLVVAVALPGLAPGGLGEQIEELLVAAFLLQPTFERSHLEVARIARPLRHAL